MPYDTATLTLLPPADDDANIPLRMHNTHTHPLLHENRPFGRLRIRFDRILHQKEDEQSLHLLLSEMPSGKRKAVSNAETPKPFVFVSLTFPRTSKLHLPTAWYGS